MAAGVACSPCRIYASSYSSRSDWVSRWQQRNTQNSTAPRHPKRTLFYQTVAEHFETWHALSSAVQGDHHTPKPFVRRAFRKYLECGIFAHGFARARCDDCGHDYCARAPLTMERLRKEGAFMVRYLAPCG